MSENAPRRCDSSRLRGASLLVLPSVSNQPEEICILQLTLDLATPVVPDQQTLTHSATHTTAGHGYGKVIHKLTGASIGVAGLEEV